MNIQQLDEIQQFYAKLYLLVRTLKKEHAEKKEEEVKVMIKVWLLEMKKTKVFGEFCRHEIMYMIDDLNRYSFRKFIMNVRNLERNVNAIKLEMVEDATLSFDIFQGNQQVCASSHI
ncbi:TPA: hypothetical protein JD264_18380 [Serratia fonticola]|nr:hypothetical protein [Serratia fonticola]